jgi:hypothetical protein
MSAKERKNLENTSYILNTKLEEKKVHKEEISDNKARLKIKSIHL